MVVQLAESAMVERGFLTPNCVNKAMFEENLGKTPDWRDEYLLELRESHRQGMRIIAEGDIVLVHEDDKRRNNWKLGKVDILIPGKDGEIRGANVTVSSSVLNPSMIRRPVQKLYPVEVSGFVKGEEAVAEEDDREGRHIENTTKENTSS
ncbi:Hypothetical predicted protein [Paramuricea clavata]|uniref:Uncharacterized protein n=1 Tax=Paramuricea clavata TaxID=317549 RepID=A0A7D9EJW8_PARCT|nr:Hypothetical predicted protein [Paramuricea clavata]